MRLAVILSFKILLFNDNTIVLQLCSFSFFQKWFCMMVQGVEPKEMYCPMEIGVQPASIILRPKELKLIKEESELIKGVFLQLMLTHKSEVYQYANFIPVLRKISVFLRVLAVL